MTNLEHLIENGIVAMEKKMTPQDWISHMANDTNWKGNERFTMDDIWEICQYAVYTYRSVVIEDFLDDLKTYIVGDQE